MSVPPIQPMHEALYIECLYMMTSSVCESVNHIAKLIEHLEKTGDFDAVDDDSLLDLLHNVVNQAAGLSRYFWAARKGDGLHSKRSRYLRDAFEISNQSCLRNRDLRNQIEHFDEKLDVFLAESPVGNFIPKYVGYSNRIEEAQMHLFRGYILDTGEFEILGKRYFVQPIVDEIAALHEKLQHCRKNGFRFSRKNDPFSIDS